MRQEVPVDCPHCHNEIPSLTCAHCRAEVPEDGVFCHKCGLRLADTTTSATAADPDDPFADRVLCSDEACIGVIGPDGRCKECGKPLQAAPTA